MYYSIKAHQYLGVWINKIMGKWENVLFMYLYINVQRTYQNICCTLDYKAMSETVQPNGATLLIEVNLLFRQKMAYPTAGTETWGGKKDSAL